MQVKFSFFLREAILFALAMTTGIFVAQHYGFSGNETIIVEPLQFGWRDVGTIGAFFILFSFVLARFRTIAGLVFRLFLTLIIIAGSQLFFASFFASPWDLYLALALALVILFARNALSHNVGMILGISGVAALLGLSITPITALLAIAALSIYDIIAVYKTRHMVRLAQNMIQSRAIFGFLIPIRLRDFFAPLGDGAVEQRYMILGSGDIGLPIMFAASLVSTSLCAAIIVGCASLVGLFVTHLLFVNQGERRAMAALPPIATASIIGYLISLFVA